LSKAVTGFQLALTATERVHNFDFVAFTQDETVVLAFRHNATVNFNGNSPFCEALCLQKLRDAGVDVDLKRLAVKKNFHGLL
jgi:hypothetical protein